VSAIARLREKLGHDLEVVELTRVVVPPHPSHTKDGKPIMVDGYSYERDTKGHEIPGSRKIIKADSSTPIGKLMSKVPKKPLVEYEEQQRQKKSIKAIPKASSTKKGPTPPGIDSGSGTEDDPWVTSDVEAAAAALSRDEHVQLKSKKQVSTLLDKLGAWAKEAEAKGDKAPVFDLCKVSIPKTNLFCAENKGIPRVEMPQLSGKPRPGSRADREFTKDKKGEVNLSEAFAEFLSQQAGVEISDEDYDASYLKATQKEMRGGKVGGMMGALRSGNFDDSKMRLWVSDEDYVIDGHHRWAAHVGLGSDEPKHMIPIRRVHMPIIEVLELSRAWAQEMGLEGAGV
jgi:hypothetical protein